jgi:hypothetical protein
VTTAVVAVLDRTWGKPALSFADEDSLPNQLLR